MRERFGGEDRACARSQVSRSDGGLDAPGSAAARERRPDRDPGARCGAGGCQSLHTNGYDEALSLPTEEAASLALRTQQVIAHESGVADFVDALGGSYAVEAMTDRIERLARGYIDKIDELGGMVAAIETGYVQREIQSTAYRYQLAVESGERVIVGVNGTPRSAKSPCPFCASTPTSSANRSSA